jgi:hypothetical protein
LSTVEWAQAGSNDRSKKVLQRLLTVVKLQSIGMAWVMRTGDALGAEGGDGCSFTGV